MSKTKIIIVQVAITAVILFFYCLFRFPYLRENIAETWRLSTTSIPESLTELYFEDHTHLPNTIEVGRPMSFSFTIHNLENKTTDYSYVIYIENDESIKVVKAQRTTVEDQVSKTINEQVVLTENVRTRVVVQLTGETTHQIAFWMEPKQ